MKHNVHTSSLMLLFFLCSISFLILCSRAEDDSPQTNTTETVSSTPELADYMGKLQQYTHKFALSVAAENQEAADFYLHEVEAMTEAIQKDVPEYEGYDIASLMNSMLISRMEAVETSLDENNWQDIRSKLIALVDACNSCHHATDHGFIEVTPGFDTNPYNQAF